MITLIETKHIGKKTFKMGTITVSLPTIITTEHVGMVVRYRRQRPTNQQVDIIRRELVNA